MGCVRGLRYAVGPVPEDTALTRRSGGDEDERAPTRADGVRGTGLEPITLRLAWTTTGRQTDAGNRARRSAVG